MVIRYYVLLLLCYHYLVNKDLHKTNQKIRTLMSFPFEV